MAIRFSLGDHAALIYHIQCINTKEHRYNQKGILQRLQQKGIAIQSMQEIETKVSPDPLQLKWSDYYLATRVEGAYVLREHLDDKVPLYRCYRAIDQLVSDEYEGRFGGEHTKAEEIVNSALSYMRNPSQNAYSFRNRAEAIPGIDVLFAGFTVSALEGFFAFETTQSVGYAAFASFVGMIGGIGLGVYVDSWMNHDFIPTVRKRRGTHQPDTPSILQRRLLQKKERYEKMCRYALNA